MVLTGSFVLTPETGLCCLRHRRDAKHHRQLDISVGISGPHDFTVRIRRTGHSRRTRPPHPAPNVRDDRETPLLIGHRMREEKPLICPSVQAQYSGVSAGWPDQLEWIFEFVFLAHPPR
jgi:hypothetical protein